MPLSPPNQQNAPAKPLARLMAVVRGGGHRHAATSSTQAKTATPASTTATARAAARRVDPAVPTGQDCGEDHGAGVNLP